jgi:hypothetical protein
LEKILNGLTGQFKDQINNLAPSVYYLTKKTDPEFQKLKVKTHLLSNGRPLHYHSLLDALAIILASPKMTKGIKDFTCFSLALQ